MVRSYWLVPERVENFETDVRFDFKVKGFPERLRNSVSKIRPGDRLVIYIASHKSVIAGILTAKSECYKKKDLIWDDFFNLRIDTETYIILNEGQFVRFRDLVNDLEFIKNKRAWKVYLMRSLVKIPQKDYLFIEREVKQNYRKVRKKVS